MRYKQKNKCLATWVRPELADAFRAALKAEGKNTNEFLGKFVEEYMRERGQSSSIQRGNVPSSVPPSDATLTAPASATNDGATP